MTLAAAGARICGEPPAAQAQPSAEQVLTDLHLSAADRQRVLSGEFVNADVPAVSERDLSFATAFLVKTSPQTLGKRVMSGDLVTADAQVQTWGELKAAGSRTDVARLTITSDEARALSAAKGLDALNLSGGEAAALTAARGAPDAILEALRTMLLARYQAYRTSGLAGIAPYDRGSGRTTDHAADLRRASEASAGLKKYLTAFQAVLLGYPRRASRRCRRAFSGRSRSSRARRPTF
jgi:hypothetical protein